jgi:YHS domain-containing protein
MKYVYIFIAVVILLVGGFATVKKVSPVSWGWWGTTNTSSGLALKGYDPVAYFDSGAPVEGDPEFTAEWADAMWQFASAEHRERFVANPEQYAPQFGGFCAFAVSKGFTADVSPDAWYVEDGKLYVFADQKVRDQWVAGLPDGTLDQSGSNWAER